MSYILNKIEVGLLQTNCYILADADTKRCVIVDPGAEHEKIMRFIKEKDYKPAFIINTHAHPDHIGANNHLNLPVYIYPEGARFLQERPDKLLLDGDEIKLDSLTLKVIHTPGHSPGGICLLCDDILLSGDTLFAAGVGRTDLPFGDEEQLINSIKNKLFILDDNIKVYPGHGPDTTIGQEKPACR